MASINAFGSYIPATSYVHGMNAQVKIILACVFSIVVFAVETWWGITVLLVITAASYLLAKIPLRSALRGLAPVAFILIFTIVVHMFSNHIGAGVVNEGLGSLRTLREWAIVGAFGISLDGLCCGVFLALRVALLLCACSLLTFTTQLMQITDALRAFLGPLRRLHVPVEDISTIVSLALRFVPITAEQAWSIRKAQMARGADFENGNVLVRLKAWAPVVVPLFVALFRRADRLAFVMDARCYNSKRRTSLKVSSLSRGDVAMCCVGVLVCLVIALVL